MDRPAILKTSRPGVPGRAGDMCWFSTASCSSVQWKVNQTSLYPSLFIILLSQNEFEKQERVRTFKKWLILEQKNGRTLIITTMELLLEIFEPWSKFSNLHLTFFRTLV